MKYHPLLTPAAGLLVVAIVADTIARLFYLYTAFVWFDLLVHFLAASGLGVVILWSIYFSPWAVSVSHRDFVLVLVGVSLVTIAGIFWEWFDYIRGTVTSQNYVFDTSLDIIMDIAGAFFASWIVLRHRRDHQLSSHQDRSV